MIHNPSTWKPLNRALGFGLVVLSLVAALPGMVRADGSVTKGERQQAATNRPVTQQAARTVVAEPVIEMAILLDTSGSMDGLIDQARTQLWRIVNEFATARHQGQRPSLRVGLYEYGKSSIPASEGYLRMILPLTQDLDAISEELFALKTNGGSEHCGQVIAQAVSGLQWGSGPGVMRVIFIAGNEPFTQGPVDFREACRAAVSRGVIVNTIHCGQKQAGINGHWDEGAKIGRGAFMNIDQNRKPLAIDAPQDKQLAQLSQKLNETYVGLGAAGEQAKRRQVAQDAAAARAAPQAAAQRAMTKGSAMYKAANWDLVDAVEGGKVDLKEIDDRKLPEAIQGKSLEEKRAYVEKLAQRRKELQAQIRRLGQERRAYVAKQPRQRAQQSDDGAETLDSALIKIIREQATAEGYEFVEPDAPAAGSPTTPAKTPSGD